MCTSMCQNRGIPTLSFGFPLGKPNQNTLVSARFQSRMPPGSRTGLTTISASHCQSADIWPKSHRHFGNWLKQLPGILKQAWASKSRKVDKRISENEHRVNALSKHIAPVPVAGGHTVYVALLLRENELTMAPLKLRS